MSEESGSRARTALTVVGVVGGTVAGVGVAVVAAPVVLTAAGFTSAGIAAGSLGASMMSAAATSGFGMGVVSVLQSAGAAGVGAATLVGGGTVGGVVGGVTSWLTGFRRTEPPADAGDGTEGDGHPGDGPPGAWPPGDGTAQTNETGVAATEESNAVNTETPETLLIDLETDMDENNDAGIEF